jgi:hypothetical protein
VIDRYDSLNPNLEFRHTLNEGTILRVPQDNINFNQVLGIHFKYEGEVYIIDDGWQENLIMVCYLINGDYDHIQESDKIEGSKARNTIKEHIEVCMNMEDFKAKYTGNNLVYKFALDQFDITVEFKTINNLVNNNKERKLNNLPYYPYIKGMDKYNTYYVCLFAKRNNEWCGAACDINSVEAFMAKLIRRMNELETGNTYHYKPVQITQKVLRPSSPQSVMATTVDDICSM